MGELKNEFIDDAVNALRSANQFLVDVRRIVEDKVVLIEMREVLAADAASHLKKGGQFHLTCIFVS